MDPSPHAFVPPAGFSQPSTPSPPSSPITVIWHDPAERYYSAQTSPNWGSPLPTTTRSATMPAKATWSPDASGNVGLGLNFGGSPLTAVKKQRSFTPSIPSPLRQQQRSPNISQQDRKTYPLMQLEFGSHRKLADQPRIHHNLAVSDAAAASEMKPNVISTRVHLPGPWPSPPNQNDRVLAVSTLSPHYLETNPELADAPTPIFRQNNHPQGWKRVTTVQGARIEEAFEGAYKIVCGLNPEVFPMTYGTRVINIKTESIENMHIAIKRGVWSTLDKVSRRIMVVWNDRKNLHEKVLLLFAVNGSKNYCGLAEMAGSYDPDSPVEGWHGTGCSGSIPLTWLYVKNVPYTNVGHITQLHNNQPVVNMWNGMKITSETARKVVEVYVSTPHFTNILAWLEGTGNQVHARLRAQSSNSTLNTGRGPMSAPPAHGGRRAVTATTTNNWRAEARTLTNEGSDEEQQEKNVTPTPQPRAVRRVFTDTPPQFGRKVPSPTSAVVNVPCIMNADGSFAVIGGPDKAEQQAAERPAHQQQPAPTPFQASHDAFSGAQATSTRHRGRGGPRGGMRGGMAQALHLRGTRSIPTIRESDFDKFRNLTSDISVTSECQQGLDMHSTPRPISTSTSHFDLRYGFPHATSAESLIPPYRPDHNYTAQHLSDSVDQGTITPIGKFPDPFVASTDKPHHVRTKSQASQSSYPRSMEDADSLAGYKPMHRLPELKRNRDSQTMRTSYTPTIGTYQAHSPLVLEEWKNRAANDRSRPKEQTSSFYPTAVDHTVSVSDSGHSLRSFRSDTSKLSLRQQAEYYRILAEKAEYEANMNERLARLGIENGRIKIPHIPLASSDTSSRVHTDGSSEVGSTVETSSIEGYNVSPVRNKAGNVLRSVSKHGSSSRARPTTAGLRARTAPYHDSWDSSIKRSVHQLVTSPPSSSVDNNVHVSPPTVSSDSDSTHGHSGGINLQY